MLAAALTLHLIPMPQSVQTHECVFKIRGPLVTPAGNLDPAAMDEINGRWKSLGIPLIQTSQDEINIWRSGGIRVFSILSTPGHGLRMPYVTVERIAMPPQSYRLHISTQNGVEIQSGDTDGTFYAAMTLAQLPQRVNGEWILPCVDISDAPALKWRVLSDDVSRGPLPNMRYFKERIRTIAAFKMNGYSPYMEHVFVDPHNPLPAPLDGITPAQLRELYDYAKRYHVTFIPEQQSFAHMHNTLAVEKYATAAEFQHDFLLSPASPLSIRYLTQLVRDELAVIPHPMFFHIGSDETSVLGLGQSKTVVTQRGLSRVYADH